MGVDMSQPPDEDLLTAALNENPAFDRLRKMGYETISIPSGFDHIHERNMDVDLDTGQMTQLELRLLESSQVNLWFHDWIETTWVRNQLTARSKASTGSSRWRRLPRTVLERSSSICHCHTSHSRQPQTVRLARSTRRRTAR